MIKFAKNLDILASMPRSLTPWGVPQISPRDSFAAQAMGVKDPNFIHPSSVKGRMLGREAANPAIAALRKAPPKAPPIKAPENFYPRTPTILDTIMGGGGKFQFPKLFSQPALFGSTAGGLTGRSLPGIFNQVNSLMSRKLGMGQSVLNMLQDPQLMKMMGTGQTYNMLRGMRQNARPGPATTMFSSNQPE
jgi:hypothetical protein